MLSRAELTNRGNVQISSSDPLESPKINQKQQNFQFVIGQDCFYSQYSGASPVSSLSTFHRDDSPTLRLTTLRRKGSMRDLNQVNPSMFFITNTYDFVSTIAMVLTPAADPELDCLSLPPATVSHGNDPCWATYSGLKDRSGSVHH